MVPDDSAVDPFVEPEGRILVALGIPIVSLRVDVCVCEKPPPVPLTDPEVWPYVDCGIEEFPPD